jgi:hypothetical protein
MVLKTKKEGPASFKLKGIVKEESPEGKPLYQVLIESGSNRTTTERDGTFDIEISLDDNGDFALSATKKDFLEWADWGHLDHETLKHGLLIYMTKSKPSGPGCCCGQVTVCATGIGTQAKVRLDAKPWTNTNASGNYGPLCAPAGWHTLWAKKTNIAAKPFSVYLPLGATVPINICI